MFIRVKSTPNSPRKSVQLVESFREHGKPRQRIVRHIGIAANDGELDTLRRLAERVKIEVLHKKQRSIVGMDQLSDELLREGRAAAEGEADIPPMPVDLRDIRERERLVTGIHEIYGIVYRLLGFDRLLPKYRYRASHRALYHLALARIARPGSKRASVLDLSGHFGVELPLEKVYRMMDRLDEAVIGRLKRQVAAQAADLVAQPLEVLFFDCTTLYFESVEEDGLRGFGYSKDGKPGEVQVLLALMVTRDGLPVSYEVFPGWTYEGHTLAPMLRWMKKVREEAGHGPAQPVVVADAGLFSKDNLTLMEQDGARYIVGARLKNQVKGVKERILDTGRYRRIPGSDRRVGVFRNPEGRRLVVTHCPRRARKDAHDRDRAIRKLKKELSRSDTPEQLLSKRKYGGFLRIKGTSRVVLDPDRIAEAARWDGLHGVVTNVRGMGVREIAGHYRGLWQVEESFRISKHDLRVRPIFHWTERRIRAHLAISFMAFACVRHLCWRLGQQESGRLSPERIRRALLDRQCSVLEDTGTGRRYALPSRPSSEAEAIYRIMGLPLSQVPYELTDPEVIQAETGGM